MDAKTRRKQELARLYREQQQLKQYQNNKQNYLGDAVGAYKDYKIAKAKMNNALNAGENISKLGNKAIGFGNKLQGYDNKIASNIGNKFVSAGNKAVNSGNQLQAGINKFATLGKTASPVTNTANIANATNSASNIAQASNAVNNAVNAGTAINTAGGTVAGTTGATSAGLGATTAGTTGATLGASTAGATAGAGASAGATAGATGTASGLAGAGAGAGVAGAVGTAVPVVAALYAVYKLYDSYKKKKQAKQMQKSMQALQQNEQEANQNRAEVMQNVQNNIKPIPTQFNTPELQQEQEMKQVEQAMEQQPVEQPVQQPQTNEQLTQSLMNEYNQLEGAPTGYASPVNTVEQQPIPEQVEAPVVQPEVAEEDSKANKIASLLNDFKAGYEDNTQNEFSMSNLAKDENKSWANRVGELVGTGQRIASNPWVQGGVAGGVEYANNGHIGDAILSGIDWARNKHKSDTYEKLINPDMKGRRTVGGFTRDDYKVYVDANRKEVQNNNDTQRTGAYVDNVNSQINDRTVKQKQGQARLDETSRHNRVTEGIGQQNANTNAKRADIYAQNAGKSKPIKPQQHEDWGNDLAGYIERLNDPRYEKQISKMKSMFIQKYGVDPDKYIRM